MSIWWDPTACGLQDPHYDGARCHRPSEREHSGGNVISNVRELLVAHGGSVDRGARINDLVDDDHRSPVRIRDRAGPRTAQRGAQHFAVERTPFGHAGRQTPGRRQHGRSHQSDQGSCPASRRNCRGRAIRSRRGSIALHLRGATRNQRPPCCSAAFSPASWCLPS